MKGKMSGNPTNIICWLVGGYFDNTIYSIAYDHENLLSEIQMHHFENPRATNQGVKILGVTQSAPDDIPVVENYELMYFEDDGPPNFAAYVCEQHEELYNAWKMNKLKMANQFKAEKGYDLPQEHLDPKNMSGEIRKVDIS